MKLIIYSFCLLLYFISPAFSLPRCGIYVTAWVAGSSRIDSLIQKAKGTRINSLVIHIKDEWGYVYVPVSHPLVRQAGMQRTAIANPGALVKKLKSHGIYVIGKIDCFKSKRLADRQVQLAVLDRNTGDVWRDEKEMSWVDPFARDVWDLNIACAQVIAKAGFDEVQFDYVRFPDGGVLEDCYYPFNVKDQTKSVAIEGFLKQAAAALAPYKVKVSADLFGITPWKDVSHTLGQSLERVGGIVNYVYPMLYPSHFPPSFYTKEGIPYSDPYKVIYQSCVKGNRQLQGRQAALRPWLQGFDYRVRDFGPDYIVTQIQAAEAAGNKEWFIWNARCDYTETWQALKKLGE